MDSEFVGNCWFEILLPTYYCHLLSLCWGMDWLPGVEAGRCGCASADKICEIFLEIRVAMQWQQEVG